MNDNLPPVPLRDALSIALNLAILIGGAYALFAIAHWLEWGKPITRVLNIPCDGAHGRVLIGAAIPVLVGFLYFSYSPQVELVIYGSARYLMFAMPGLAVISGLGVAALLSVARGSPVARAVLLVPVIAATAAPAWALTESLRSLDKPWDKAGRDFMGGLNQVSTEMGWDLASTVGRTMILRRHEAAVDRWRFESIFGIGYELHRTGTPVPFSMKGTCAAFLTGGAGIYGEKGMPLEALARSLEQPLLKLSIVRQKRFSGDLLVVYQRDEGRGYCFTSISNRYVFSEEEKAMFLRYGKLKPASAEPTTATVGPGSNGYMLNLGEGIYALLKLGASGGKLALELHSNQLRGDTYNGGFLDIGMIEAPKLVLRPTRGGAPIEIVIEAGLVGGKGTFTPLRQLHDLPAGTFDVDFVASVYPPVKLGTWPVDFTTKTPVSIPVARALALPVERQAIEEKGPRR